MLPLSRILPTLTLIAASLDATGASGQHYRPDAEAYPCAVAKQLSIVQDEHGFSIKAKAKTAASPAKPLTDTEIAIGGALRLDRRIFSMSTQRAEDKTDARHN